MPDTYRGSRKHKDRPAIGRKGTLCPEWTHVTETGRLANDVVGHDWPKTEAYRLFEASEPCPEGSGRRFATSRGIAFAAVSSRDGTWHGYPVPWQEVPAELKDRWRDAGKVERRDLRRHMDRSQDDVRWALESDDD